MTNNRHETAFLLREVSRTYGGRIETTTDFDALADDIEDRLGERVSPSTLKRIWGYVRLQPRQRLSTLDLLARYTGRADYRALCIELQETSDYFSEESVMAREMEPGQRITLQWMPDRTVTLRHLSGTDFEVEEAGSSKLRKGDRVSAVGFILGQPLYLDIVREGEALPPYASGRSRGLTGIRIEP